MICVRTFVRQLAASRVRLLLFAVAVTVAVVGLLSPAPAPPGIEASSTADLDIMFIGRTPRHPRLCPPLSLRAASGFPCDPSATVHEPEDQDEVTITARIANKGGATSSGAAYTWWLKTGPGQEEVYASGTIASGIAPGAVAELSVDWQWYGGGHQTHVYPQLRLELSPSGADAYAANNNLTYYLLGKSLLFLVQNDNYTAYDTAWNGASFSFEGWLQRTVADMNRMMADSQAHDGPVRERINVEMVYRVESDATAQEAAAEFTTETGEPTWNFDTIWLHGGTTEVGSGVVTQIDRGLIHELGHQLGLVDIYNIPQTGGPGCSSGIMDDHLNLNGDCAGNFERVHANALNRRLPHRSGYMGEFLYDVPDPLQVKIQNQSGPVANAEVVIEQRDAGINGMRLVGYGRTLADGTLVLPTQTLPSGLAGETTTGYELQDNPFGSLHNNAHNAWLWLNVVREDGLVSARLILDLPWVNVHAEEGSGPIVLQTSMASSAASDGTFTLSATDAAAPWTKTIQASGLPSVQRVDFFVDGALRSSDASSPYTFDVPLLHEEPGNHWVSARSYSTGGGYRLSNTLVVESPTSEGSRFAQLGVNKAAGTQPYFSGYGLLPPAGAEAELRKITDGSDQTHWADAMTAGSYLQIPLSGSSSIGGVRITNLTFDHCPEFDLYTTTSPGLSPGALPVLANKVSAVGQRVYTFTPRTASYIIYVCRKTKPMVRIAGIEAFTPATAPTKARAVEATLSHEGLEAAQSALVTWASEGSSYYFRLCTDSAAAGSYTTCEYTMADEVAKGLPAADGLVAHYKVDRCTIYGACSGLTTAFAGVGRATNAGADYVSSFYRDGGEVHVQNSAHPAHVASGTPIQVFIAQGSSLDIHDIEGSVCLNASAGWTAPPFVLPAHRLVGGTSFATLHTTGSCDPGAVPQAATGRSASVLGLPFGPTDLRSSFTSGGRRVEWTPRSGTAFQQVCRGAALYEEASSCTWLTGTATSHTIGASGWTGPQYVWISSCDAAVVCGSPSRSYAYFDMQTDAAGLNYAWTYYKTASTFGFQLKNDSPLALALDVRMGSGAAGEAIFAQPPCAQSATIATPVTKPAADVPGDTISVSRVAYGGSACPIGPGHAIDPPDHVLVSSVRAAPVAPSAVDFTMTDTGAAPNVYRVKMDWPNDPNVYAYKLCTSANNVTYSCFIPLVASTLHASLPSSATHYRFQACDEDWVCSDRSPDYVRVHRVVSGGWNFTVAHRSADDVVKLQMLNTSAYLGWPLWVKLHVLNGTDVLPSLELCVRNAAGQGPISAPVGAPRSTFTSNTIGIENHALGQAGAASCSAADSTPDVHTSDGNLVDTTSGLD